MNPLFINPYIDLRKTLNPKDILRLSVDVPKADARVIRSVLIDYGSLNTIELLLVKHLTDYVREHNLTVADHDQFIDYICFLLCPTSGPGSSSRRPDKETGRGNERRRTRRVHSDGPKSANKSTTCVREQTGGKKE